LIGFLVEFGQEGVVGKFLQHQTGMVVLAQQVGQGGLSGTDVAFDRNEMMLHGRATNYAISSAQNVFAFIG